MALTRPTRLKVLAVVAIAALGLAACGSSKKSSTSNTTASGGGGASSATTTVNSGGLKLGFFGALTGPNAQLGLNILWGEQVAVNQYNATNPPVKVTVDKFDSQGDPSQANNGATKLINDKVVAVIGPAFSGESAAADPIFESAGIPNVSASATNVKLAHNGWKYFHRVLADDSFQGPADADYLVNVLHKTTVAVIDDNSTYGKGLADAVRGKLASLSHPEVVSDHVDPNGADYGATVNRVVASHAAAVFFGGYYDAAGRLIKQLRAAGYNGTFMSGDGSEDVRFIQDAGGATNANGAFLSCACADVTTNPSAAAFVTAYKAEWGQAPAIYSAEAFDAANFVLAAIKAGSTTPSAINAYLGSHSWTGLTKTIKFGPNGNISGGTIYMYKVEGAQIVQIGTTS